ncbi:hypothetical protein NO1_1531 [Candidatus Termititenax aidoneus]|uniref:Uncharacterized protein n=1 Tax=Termititenax aidoneus TaxID=2218524 RepID=A0A388TD07_TERA1|nr:hypothetical protein NO1_1531 [Candidatus Termititenax aidoneus]
MYTKDIAVTEKLDTLTEKLCVEAFGNDYANQVIPLQQLEQIHVAIKNLLEYLFIASTLIDLYTLKTPVVKIQDNNTNLRYAVKIPNLPDIKAVYITFVLSGQEFRPEDLKGLSSGSVIARLDVQESLQLLFNQPEIEGTGKLHAREIISIWENIQKAKQLNDLQQLYAEDLLVQENSDSSGYTYGNAAINVRINMDDKQVEIPYEIDFFWETTLQGEFKVSDLNLIKKQNKDTRQNMEQRITFGGKRGKTTEELFRTAACRDIPQMFWNRVLDKLDYLNKISGDKAAFYQWQNQKQYGNKIEYFENPSSLGGEFRDNPHYKGIYSVRVNDAYRIVFKWSETTGEITDVEFIPHY